jgi:hypothetical protein
LTRKSIQTNSPVMSCDVCGRTLLRGETSDVFLAGGQRRIVCELCTSRAQHEGWIREGLDALGTRQHEGRGRGRGALLGRLRARRERAAEPAREADEPPSFEPEPVDYRPVEPEPVAPPPAPVAPAAPEEEMYAHRSVRGVPTNAELKVARALEVFNASAHPRTVAGVARSLGAPIVAARPSATEGSLVSIVVAWELSWYRYEVDLGDEAAGVRVIAQGTELAELEPADQTANAAADEAGQLHPASTLA